MSVLSPTSAIQTLLMLTLMLSIFSGQAQDSEFSGASPSPLLDGIWSEWSEWSCSVTCGKIGEYQRTRSCELSDGTVVKDIDAEVFCGGVADESKICPYLEPCPGGWSDWGDWGKCSVTCGEGVRERTRNCGSGDVYECVGESVNSEPCKPSLVCPRDGNWGGWSPWSGCSKSCGEEGIATRRRDCDSPPPLFQGRDCEGPRELAARCNIICCPQDGRWGAWNQWGKCTRTCGVAGARIRKRLCNDPTPSPEPCPGKHCSGNDTDLGECNRKPCPVDGGWCAWSTWAICTTTCGQGVQRRSRSCTSPLPLSGGEPCVGDSSEARTCVMAPFCPMVSEWSQWTPISRCPDECGEGGILFFTRQCQPGMFNFGSDSCPGNASKTRVCDVGECPLSGGWSYWSCWSSCAVTCGQGVRNRRRYCNNPPPTIDACQGPGQESEECNGAVDECPVDGGWSSWEDWGGCSKTCGGGFRFRFRRCDSPTRSDTGTYCPGTNRERQDCGSDPCVVDGEWTTWGCWSSCSITCGVNGVRRRERSCSNPSPVNGGNACIGPRFETKDCDGMPSCAVDGGWCPWSEWSEYDKTCGRDATRSRQRYCTDPKPQTDGRYCIGSSTDMQVVDVEPCPKNRYWTAWSCWSDCSATCGEGSEERTRTCVIPIGNRQPCDGPNKEERSCNEGPCAINGRWSAWGAWTICSRTCGRGVQNRSRTCDEPRPSNGGLQCQEQRNQVRNCTIRACPMDGGWSEWACWSRCSVTCGIGERTRDRTCSNPAPTKTGSDCRGDALETAECEASFRCGQDGGLSNWGQWTDCSRTCNGGLRRRTRTCSRPVPVLDGLDCESPRTEYEVCNNDTRCPCDGHWSVWGEWSDCSVTKCSMDGVRQRKRMCNAPPHVAGGKTCPGQDTDIEDCSTSQCESPSNKRPEWSEWSEWSNCSASCGDERQERQSRTRTCTNNETETCSGSDTEYRFCKLPPCSDPCSWSHWSCWNKCSVTCDTGLRFRSRNCTSPPNEQCAAVNCPGNPSSSEECNARCCPQVGSWSNWSAWTACSKTCGCDGYKLRSRTCTNPSPSCGGHNCDGTDMEKQRCNRASCPIDGSWSEWGCWSTCSVSCGSGTQTTRRNCTNPAPKFGGSECDGEHSMTRVCSPRPCLVGGKWSDWSAWTDCSRTCGDFGYQTRYRRCEYPLPNARGTSCEGPSEAIRPCARENCPQDGGWSVWTRWTGCAACGPSTKARSRSCTNPPPSDGGADCAGPKDENEHCLIVPCPVNGNWSSWSEWTMCSKTCGGGAKDRCRNCNYPRPMLGGNNCEGLASESMSCNTQPCPCHGDWSDWFDGGCCSAECGTGGGKLQVRHCNSPVPAYGGSTCAGSSEVTLLCSRLHLCSIDGHWSPWGSWSVCSRTCGKDGRRTRERECSSPEPQRGGANCPGAAVENQLCTFLQHCPCEGAWSEWGKWSGCSVSMGSGTQRSYRTCTNPTPNNTDSTCQGDDQRTQSCHFSEPGDGKWCEWGGWSPCLVTCGDSQQVRKRVCSCPAPSNGGKNCDGTAREGKSCDVLHCPIDGGWTHWGCWGSCSSTCGDVGRQSRSRTCTNPAPRYNGSSCAGSMTDSQPCLPEVSCAPERQWSAWGQWSDCGVTCGLHITRRRTRMCVSSGEDTGGHFCPGSSTDVHSCNLAECPCDGGYTVWNQWADCSMTCGSGGVRTRTRRCINPPPANGGDDCSGESASESESCTGDTCCGIKGSWSSFGKFSACSRDCYGGFRVAYRHCSNPEPLCGGQDCEGPSSIVESCNEQPCPCDGGWSNWSIWSNCDKTCGDGKRVRTRSCNNPAPTDGGVVCTGLSTDTKDCFIDDCLVDCEWSSWGEWNSCNKPCGSDAAQQRKRTCTCPAPNAKGLNCKGADTDPRICDLLPCPCDGGWGIWGLWAACTITCRSTAYDYGTRTRLRTCNNPEPSETGLHCFIDAVGLADSETDTCERLYRCPIDGSWGEWQSWSSCSKTCGSGFTRRERACNKPAPASKGNYCAGTSLAVLACNNQSCPCDGKYGAWGPWSACSVTCGSGYKSRYRDCVNPVPAYGGKDCGPTQNKQTTHCFQAFQCPRDGTWTQWSSWSLCSVYCGYGIRQRFRTCQNPGFTYHYREGLQLPGRNCPGKSHEIETCHQECVNDNVVQCCEPQPLTDGRFSVAHVTSYKATDVGFAVGTVITYECDPNIAGLTLELVGPRTRRCLSNGQWSSDDPRCEVVTALTSDRFRRSATNSNGNRTRRSGHNVRSLLRKATRSLKRTVRLNNR